MVNIQKNRYTKKEKEKEKGEEEEEEHLSLEAYPLHYSPVFSLVVILGRAIRVQNGSGDDAIELCEFWVALQDLLLHGREHAFSINWTNQESQLMSFA